MAYKQSSAQSLFETQVLKKEPEEKKKSEERESNKKSPHKGEKPENPDLQIDEQEKNDLPTKDTESNQVTKKEKELLPEQGKPLKAISIKTTSKENWVNTSVTLTGQNAVFLKKMAIFKKKTQTDFLYEIMKKEYDLHIKEVEDPTNASFEPIQSSIMRPKQNGKSLSIRLPREIMDYITLYAMMKGISKSSYVDDVITGLRNNYKP